jgi:MFS family permease
MEEKVEKLCKLVNTKQNQYLILIIAFLLNMNICIMLISLPFIEKNPEVSYIDPQSGETIITTLTYEICENKSNTYQKVKEYGFSWTSEFEITCNEFQTSLIGNFAFIGAFLGSLFFPLINSKLDRRLIMFYCTCLYSASLILCQFITNFYILGVLIMLATIFYFVCQLGIYLYLADVLESDSRSLGTLMLNVSHNINALIYIYIFKYSENWRLTYLISASTVLALIFWFYLVSAESPKYYIAKGHVNEFLFALRTLAAKNKRTQVLESELNNPRSELYHEHIVNQFNEELKSKSDNKGVNYNLFSFLNDPSTRRLFIILTILYLSVTGTYYSNSITLKLLPGDIFINVTINYILELTSYIVSGYLIELQRLGRKKTLQLFYISIIISNIILYCFKVSDLTILILSFISRFSVASIFNIKITYSLELYSATVRSQAFGFNVAIANAFNVIFPLIIEYTGDSILLIMAALNLLCCLLLITLPETLRVKGEDNIELSKTETTCSKDPLQLENSK